MRLLVYIMCKMVFPGIDSIQNELIFRSVGDSSRRQRIGCGFIHKAGIRLDEHNSLFTTYALVYVIRGRGSYISADGQEHKLHAGSLFQRHPGQLHSTLIDPDSSLCECFLDLGRDLYQALLSMRLVFPEERVGWLPPDRGIEEEFFRLMVGLKEASERELPHQSMTILQFCASLLGRSRRDGDEGEWDRIERSCRDFRDTLGSRIDLKAYCRSRGWGYEAFRKSFTGKMGISPGQYIIQRRMDEACRLLRSGHLTVKETALRLGYKSPYEFSAQFRRCTGWSPRDYRGAQPQGAFPAGRRE